MSYPPAPRITGIKMMMYLEAKERRLFRLTVYLTTIPQVNKPQSVECEDDRIIYLKEAWKTLPFQLMTGNTCSKPSRPSHVYSRGGPHTALAPRPSLIYCAYRLHIDTT
jgi:hypothetical protein